MNTQDTVYQASEPSAIPPPPPGYGQASPPHGWERKPLYPEDPRRKSPVTAAILSGLPGLGQVYVGYYRQGFLNALIVGSIITLLNTSATRHLEPLLGIFLAFFWLYNIVDAARRASLYNHALAGMGPAELPDDLPLPGGAGSLVGGLALVVVGCVLLSNTVFGLSLEWLERWWPVALVGLGAYLAAGPLLHKRSTPKSDGPENPAA
jgi:hypothetical protein